MSWHFRALAIGEKTRDPIQGEFFATEAIRNPAEALVREAIQNSLDARIKDSIKVRLFLANGDFSASAEKISVWFDGAWEHFHAPGNGLREPPKPGTPCPYLVYEDFQTSGLTGDVSQPFDEPETNNHFYYFYRAEGRTGKKEKDLGRWGIGKYVFPRSSQLNTLFGLTVRVDDKQRFLMGQTILKSHKVNGEHYSPDGYYGIKQENGLVLPLHEKKVLDKFCADFQLTRKDESGLSLVIPFIDPEFSLNSLKEAVVRNYFYPILDGTLDVLVESPSESVNINAETLIDVAKTIVNCKDEEFLPMLELAEWAAFLHPSKIISLKPCPGQRPIWSHDLIPDDKIQELQNRLESGDKIGLRAYLTIRKKGNDDPPEDTHFDFYVWQDGNEIGKTIFIREGVIITDTKAPRTRGIRSMVVIEDKPIATLLGDAENPAHTQWQTDSSNFKNKYFYGPSYLTFVKDIVCELVRALRKKTSEEYPDLLIDYFSLDSSMEEEPLRKKKKKTPKGDESEDEIPNIEPQKKRFRIEKVQGGFMIKSSDVKVQVPAKLEIKVAYDTRRGNPLTKYNPADFVVAQGEVKIQDKIGCSIEVADGNFLLLNINNPEFTFSLKGFDQRRDLYVSAKITEDSNDTKV